MVAPDYSRLRGAGAEQKIRALCRSLVEAQSGCADAQYDVGLMYATGHGAPQDNVLAHMWGNIAAIGGDTRAREERKALSFDMSPAEIHQAQRLARERIIPLAA